MWNDSIVSSDGQFASAKLLHVNSPPQTDIFHVVHKVPLGDTPYVKAKHVQLVEKNPERAIALFWAAINAGDRVDSALKDMAVLMKQQNRAEEAIEAVKSLRSRCSDQAQESLDNVLLDLYKRCGRLDDQISLIKHKLELINKGFVFNGKRTKTARSQGKKFQVSVKQEMTRLLGNLGWAYMQKKNYVAAEIVYRKALSIGLDENKMCNLGLCLMKQGKLEEAKTVLESVKLPDGGSCGSSSDLDSHFVKSYERAQEILKELQAVMDGSTSERTKPIFECGEDESHTIKDERRRSSYLEVASRSHAVRDEPCGAIQGSCEIRKSDSKELVEELTSSLPPTLSNSVNSFTPGIVSSSRDWRVVGSKHAGKERLPLTFDRTNEHTTGWRLMETIEEDVFTSARRCLSFETSDMPTPSSWTENISDRSLSPPLKLAKSSTNKAPYYQSEEQSDLFSPSAEDNHRFLKENSEPRSSLCNMQSKDNFDLQLLMAEIAMCVSLDEITPCGPEDMFQKRLRVFQEITLPIQ